MRVAIVNSDKRMQEVYFELAHDHETVLLNEYTDFTCFDGADALVLPVKGLTSTGSLYTAKKELVFPSSFWEIMKGKPIFTGIRQTFLNDFANVHYYMEDAFVKAKNAVYTAEGTLFLLMDHTDMSIKDLSVDVIGYGLCGKEIVKWLKALHVKTRVIRRSCEEEENCISVEAYRHMECADVIINTSISPVLDHRLLTAWKHKPLIIDIATPDVIDYDTALSLGIRIIKAGNLPAMIAAKSSGKLIANYVRGKLDW